MFRDGRSLVALSHHECLALLARSQVGRVAFVEGDLPVVVPVTYAVSGDAVVFSTSSGTRLADAALGGIFAFEVDEIDPTTRTGWSVVLTGAPECVQDPIARSRIRAAVEPWAPGNFDVFLRIPLTSVTGRRVDVVGMVTAAVKEG